MDDKRELFLSHIERQLIKYYQNVKLREKEDHTAKHRIEGFMQAGVALELVNSIELQSITDKIHVEVFNMTQLERKLKVVKGEGSEIDWSIYEQSPSMRR